MTTAITLYLLGVVSGWVGAVAAEFAEPKAHFKETTALLLLWPVTVPLALALVICSLAAQKDRV